MGNKTVNENFHLVLYNRKAECNAHSTEMEKEALCEHLTTNDVDEEAIKKHMVAVSKAKYLKYFHYDRFLNARAFSCSQWLFFLPSIYSRLRGSKGNRCELRNWRFKVDVKNFNSFLKFRNRLMRISMVLECFESFQLIFLMISVRFLELIQLWTVETRSEYFKKKCQAVKPIIRNWFTFNSLFDSIRWRLRTSNRWCICINN